MSDDVTEALRNDYPKGKVKEGRLPKLMREYGNLYCDISAGSGANALMRDKEYAARFLEEFADRVLYGCDFCAVTNAHQFKLDKFLDGMVEDGYLTLENYKKIVRENAIKLLKL
jgi:predicted TIM-barrel fold metal-dependent hydrolase